MIEVPAHEVAHYDSLLCEAERVFKHNGWSLLVAGLNTAYFNSSGPPPGLLRKLLHVWAIPDFNSLPQVMAYAADDPAYVAAQALTLEEAQNLYVKLIWADPIGLPATPVAFFMVESLRIVGGTPERSAFASYMNTAVYTMNEKYGWKIMFAGNATAGLINEYVNVWGMTSVATLDEAIGVYRGDPAWKGAVTKVSTSVWTPRSLPAFQDPATAPAPIPTETIVAHASAAVASASTAASAAAEPAAETEVTDSPVETTTPVG